jgi:outer membrane protein TolC
MTRRGLGPGLALAVLSLGSVIAAFASPKDGEAHGERLAQASAARQPTPFPVVTLGPVGVPTSLPYPAYGSPVPGVNAGTAAPDVAQRVTLSQSIAVGFGRSPLLAAARADVGIQAAAVRLARAGELPSLSGSANTTYNYNQAGSISLPSSGTAFTGGRGSTFVSNSLSASLSQLIFDGGKVAASVRAAQRTETSFADTYRRELQTVAFNVATAYYNYLAAQRTTQVDVEIVKENQVQLDLVKAQVKAGTAAAVDIITTEFPLAQARVAVVKAQGAELSAGAAFSNTMGLDANVNVQPIDDTPLFGTSSQVSTLPVPSYDAAVKRGLAMRPDYDSSVQSVESAKYSLKAAKLGYVPTLVANGNYGDSSTDVGGGALRNSGSVGAALSVPIFDQGVTAANVAQAQAQLQLQQANLQTELLSVQLNVKQSLTNLVSARAQLDQTQAEYQNAVANLRATQAQYKAGVTTLPLLLNAETALTQALTDSVTAVYNLRQAEQGYLYAVGTNDQQQP